MASVDGFDWTYEDEEGPDVHDCATAAHLRDCGFCRAVRTPALDRVTAVMTELMKPGGFFEGSEPYRIWHGLPKVVIVPTPPAPKRRWWQL